MGKSRSGVLLNAAILIGGITLAALVYAFVARNWTGELETLRTTAPASAIEGVYQVEIRNGCGESGLARTTRVYLRSYGFDVVESGNYRDFEQPVSRVIDRAGDLEAARALARTLGIDNEHVSQELSSEVLLDATVILGHDYGALKPFDEREGR